MYQLDQVTKKKKRRKENQDVSMLWEGKVISMRRDKSHQIMNKVRGRWEGICVKCISTHFSLPIFLPIWKDKKGGSRKENFLSCFLSLLLSFLNQTVKNSIFHPIFHPPCFHPNQTHPKKYKKLAKERIHYKCSSAKHKITHVLSPFKLSKCLDVTINFSK